MLEPAIRERSRPAGDDIPSNVDPSSELLSALLSISKTTRAFYGLKLSALGFYNGQDELLLAIGDQAASVSVLADQLSVRPSTVSKMLDRLIDKGLCERTSDRRDMRKTLVQITPAGVEVRKQLIHLRQEVEIELTRHLDTDVRKGMTQTLSECSDHIARQLRRVR